MLRKYEGPTVLAECPRCRERVETHGNRGSSLFIGTCPKCGKQVATRIFIRWA